MEKDIILQMHKVNKTFDKVQALSNVDFELKHNEILGLLGGNGAGKTTLMNILYGLYKMDSGKVIMDDKPIAILSPKDAIRQGIGMVHQHFLQINNYTVLENIVLGSKVSHPLSSNYKDETITIKKPDREPVKGEFVDGGVSPFNNPALQALMYATLEGYRIGWPTGPEKLLLVSVGTGAADPEVKKASIAAQHAIMALLSLMQDCAMLQETMLQWMSSSPTAREIDRDMGNLRNDLVAGAPLLSYLRFNVDLQKDSVQRLDPSMTDVRAIASLSEMDAPENMDVLHRLGKLAAERDVKDADFPSVFDLTAG